VKIAVIIGETFFPAAYRTGHAIFRAVYMCLKELDVNVVFGKSLSLIDDSIDIAIILPQSFSPQEVQGRRSHTKCFLIGLTFDPLPQGRDGQYLNVFGVRGFYDNFMMYVSSLDGIMDLNMGSALFLKHSGYNAVHLKLGYHASFENSQIDKNNDVLFLGEFTRPRRRILRCINSRKHKGVFFSNNENILRDFVKFREYVACSKIMLNIHTRKKMPYFASMRIVMFGFTNQTLILTQKCEYMEDYKNGEHLIVCGDGLDFYNKIEYFLNNEKVRREIVDNAYRSINSFPLRENLRCALQELRILT